ncbi:M28 family peptidase [Actinopolymorpha sp. B17G11]|uniref:M28 family metallopeptidase n=1 Tax=Actinopolymorpha sp. B17G11 TaxID=3160861 RepID=UPI0032E435F1
MRRRDFCTTWTAWTAGLLTVAVAGCRDEGTDGPGGDAGGRTTPRGSGTPTATRSPSSGRPSPTSPDTAAPTTPTAAVSPTAATPSAPAVFDAGSARETVQLLAGRIGPREATSAAFGRAAQVVADALGVAGYDVVRQPLRVPAGISWGIRVPSGRTHNVIAALPGFDPLRPHRVVGAHLDTVPQAPGAEDNASGVAVMLELARLAAVASGGTAPPGRGGAAGDEPRVPALPVLFVAFGAEEPRGPGDAWHHFGSRHYVRTLPLAQRRAIREMVSLDRVGVGESVRIRTGGRAPYTVARALVAASRRIGVPVTRGTNQSSDHWSFEKAGIAAARVGGNPFSGYHSAADRPSAVSRSSLDRSGRLVWEWLRSR